MGRHDLTPEHVPAKIARHARRKSLPSKDDGERSPSHFLIIRKDITACLHRRGIDKRPEHLDTLVNIRKRRKNIVNPIYHTDDKKTCQFRMGTLCHKIYKVPLRLFVRSL